MCSGFFFKEQVDIGESSIIIAKYKIMIRNIF